MPLAFVFNERTSLAISQNSHSLKKLVVHSQLSTPTVGLSSVEEDDGEKKAKTVWQMDPGRSTSAHLVVGSEVRST